MPGPRVACKEIVATRACPTVDDQAGEMSGRNRAERIGALIQREMAVLLIEKVKDPRVAGITLSGIRVSKDLKSVRQYFSVIGGPGEREIARAGLESARGFLKKAIGERLALRYVPEIVFEYDDTLERGRRMEVLLGRLKGEGSENVPR